MPAQILELRMKPPFPVPKAVGVGRHHAGGTAPNCPGHATKGEVLTPLVFFIVIASLFPFWAWGRIGAVAAHGAGRVLGQRCWQPCCRCSACLPATTLMVRWSKCLSSTLLVLLVAAKALSHFCCPALPLSWWHRYWDLQFGLDGSGTGHSDAVPCCWHSHTGA